MELRYAITLIRNNSISDRMERAAPRGAPRPKSVYQLAIAVDVTLCRGR
jgi:hypothetical protein